MDLKVECAVLNVRLRTRFNNSLLPISSCGIPFESDLPVNFVNISPKCVLNVFEGKDKSICSSLLYSKNTCVIFGESFSNRISNVFLFFEYFRHFFRNISVLRVSGYLNSSAPSFANIKALAPKDLRKHYHYFCINLKDTHFLRKRLKRFIGTGLIRFNGEGSCISARLAMIVPTTIRHLTSSMYLNMENRVQRTTEEYKNCFEGHSIKSTFLRLYSSITGKKADARTHTRVLYEMLSDPSLFDHMPKGRSFGHNFSFMNKFRFFKYMDKPGPGDIYCSDGSIKDSRNMQDCVR